MNIAGNWDVQMAFIAGKGNHKLSLETTGNRVRGVHYGRIKNGDLKGTVSGSEVRFTSAMPFEGSKLEYAFTGKVSGDSMSGEFHCGEYGAGTWTAVRHSAGSLSRDPSKA